MDTRFIRHFHQFLAVAEELHFGRAATRLNMSQPPLSQRIRRLEHELGVTLFIRTKHSVELTYAGGLLLERVRRILRETELAGVIVKQAVRGEVGRLEIAFTASADLEFVPTVLPLFKKQFPRVSLELHCMHGPLQMDALRQNRVRLGIMRLPVAMIESDLVVEAVQREPLVAVVAADHPLARLERIDLRQLADEPFIFFARHISPEYYDAVMMLCSERGFTPQVVQDTDSVHTTIGLVAAGLGVSLQPACVVNIQRTGVCYRRLEEPEPTVDMGMAYRRDDKSEILRNFLHVAREHSRRSIAAEP